MRWPNSGVEMVRSEKKYLIAWTHAQAGHYARMMNWKRSEWEYVSMAGMHAEKLRGKYGVVLYDVRAPRYRPTQVEAEKMEHLRSIIQPMLDSGRIIKLNVVNLP